jgi:hypothetical protein
VDDRLYLSKLLDILDLERGLSFIIALLGASLVFGLVLINYLLDQVNKVLIIFELIRRNIVIRRFEWNFEIWEEFC